MYLIKKEWTMYHNNNLSSHNKSNNKSNVKFTKDVFNEL